MRNHNLYDDTAETKTHIEAGDAGGINPPARELDDVERAFHELRRQALWAFAAGTITTTTGVFLISMAHIYFKDGSFEQEFARDIGISVIIAGLLVIYETFTRWFGRAEAKVRMENDTQRLVQLGISVKELVGQLKMINDPVSKIRYILEVGLTPTAKYRPLISNVERLLSEIFRIHGTSNTLRVKETEEYIRLIAWILEKYVICGASGARRLLEGMSAVGDEVAEYAPPELHELTLEILSSQMRAMRKGDKYDSVASIWLYANMSRNYVNTTRKALLDGVHIRRIFNLCNLQRVSRSKELSTAIDLIKKHIAEFETGGFEYRFMTEPTLEGLDLMILQRAGVPDIEAIRTTYFGHFRHIEDKKILRFSSKSGADLTNLDLAVYSAENISNDCDAKTALFEHLWNESKVIPPDKIDMLKDG